MISRYLTSRLDVWLVNYLPRRCSLKKFGTTSLRFLTFLLRKRRMHSKVTQPTQLCNYPTLQIRSRCSSVCVKRDFQTVSWLQLNCSIYTGVFSNLKVKSLSKPQRMPVYIWNWFFTFWMSWNMRQARHECLWRISLMLFTKRFATLDSRKLIQNSQASSTSYYSKS